MDAIDKLKESAVAELKQWCAGGSDPIDNATAAGFIDNGYITDAGIAAANEAGILLRQVHLIELGVPVTAWTNGDKDRAPVKVVLREGSKLLVTFGGREKKGKRMRYWEVFVSKDFPVLTIHQNSAHKFQTDSWPLGRPIPTHFLVQDES